MRAVIGQKQAGAPWGSAPEEEDIALWRMKEWTASLRKRETDGCILTGTSCIANSKFLVKSRGRADAQKQAAMVGILSHSAFKTVILAVWESHYGRPQRS